MGGVSDGEKRMRVKSGNAMKVIVQWLRERFPT